jgi:ArsR family transcriptional regulator, arsenate/arsenite/antimonite-responsive transcriptional repressor
MPLDPTSCTLANIRSAFKSCEGLFHALGDPARQAIIVLLAEHGRLNVGQITELMPLSRPAISHHIKVLKDAGLLDLARESRENFYSLRWDEAMSQLKALVMHSEKACSRHAELLS